MSARALVTGGAGFLGAALVRQLLRMDVSVRVLDDGSRGSFERLADVQGRFEAIAGDVRDEKLVHEAASGCDLVFHLAAVNGTRFFYEEPARVLDVAIRGTLAAVSGARAARARRFLLASSGEVYHEPPRLPTPEDVPLVVPDPWNPRFSYSGGKIASELIAINLLRGSATGTIIFRPHNVYGPAMGFEHVIPNLVQKLRAAKERTVEPDSRTVELEIQGSGRETRAFCYVDDAAEAIALLAERGEVGTTYHVGRSEETTIADLARAIARVVGLEVALRPTPLPKGAPARRCPDTRRLAKLGFVARTPLSEGLERTVPYYWNAAEGTRR